MFRPLAMIQVIKSSYLFLLAMEVPISLSCGQYHTAVICAREKDDESDRVAGRPLDGLSRWRCVCCLSCLLERCWELSSQTSFQQL